MKRSVPGGITFLRGMLVGVFATLVIQAFVSCVERDPNDKAESINVNGQTIWIDREEWQDA